MPIFAYADRCGELAAADPDLFRALYLMDKAGLVVGACGQETTLSVGDCFLDPFPISAADHELLSAHLSTGTEQWLLLHTGGTAVLLDCSFFGRCGLLAAILPPADIAEHMDRPAAYGGVWQEVTLLPSALARFKPADEEVYMKVSGWLATVYPPLPRRSRTGVGSSDAALIHLCAYLAHLAALCGCALSYDLLGLGFDSVGPIDYPFLAGCLLSLFLAVRRTARGAAVRIFGDKECSEFPLLHAVFHPKNTAHPLPEFKALSDTAGQRDDVFVCSPLPDGSGQLHLRFSLCRSPIEGQGTKTVIAQSCRHTRLPYTVPDP